MFDGLIVRHGLLSENHVRQLAEALDDIARRERKPVTVLMEESMFQSVLNDEKLPRRRKAEVLLDFVRMRATPDLHRAEALWRRDLDALGRPEFLWISLAKALEGVNFLEIIDCPDARKPEARAWVRAHQHELTQLRARHLNGEL